MRTNQPSWARRTARLVWLVLAIGLAGCEGLVGPATGQGSPATLPAGEDSAAFLDRLSSQDTVSENDAMHGLILLLRGHDDATSFEQRRKRLAQQNIVSDRWAFQADRPITRGKLAYMIFQAIQPPRGVLLTLTGPNQRYCLRELEYRNFMARGFILAPTTGMEFVNVLTRADTYLRTGTYPGEEEIEEIDE